jgi:hypothetical protein
MKEINSALETYIYFEFCDSAVVDASLKRVNEDFIIDFYGFKKRLPGMSTSNFNV